MTQPPPGPTPSDHPTPTTQPTDCWPVPAPAPPVTPGWQRAVYLATSMMLLIGAVTPFVARGSDGRTYSLLRLAGFHDGAPAILGLLMLVALVIVELVMVLRTRPAPPALPVVVLVLCGIGLVMVLLRPGLRIADPVTGWGAVLLAVALLGSAAVATTQVIARRPA